MKILTINFNYDEVILFNQLSTIDESYNIQLMNNMFGIEIVDDETILQDYFKRQDYTFDVAFKFGKTYLEHHHSGYWQMNFDIKFINPLIGTKRLIYRISKNFPNITVVIKT